MYNIKIFVSNRIDLDAEQIDNSLFIPVRCGAVFDEKHSDMLGDDTGDNISNKRETFNEFTVLYWAWKNQKADYYGLCHYRRYLAFKNVEKKLAAGEHDNGCYTEEFISKKAIEAYGIDEKTMRCEIENCDAIFFKPIKLSDFNLTSNYDALKKNPKWHNIVDADKMLQIIKEKRPDIYMVAREYMFNFDYSYLYNCFVMKKEIFNDFCEFVFSIFFELEKKLDTTNYSELMTRSVGTLGERLLGIWILWMKKQNKFKIYEHPLVFFQHPEQQAVEKPFFNKNECVLACSSSNEYAPYLSVWLQSILDHASKNTNYDIFVFERGISAENKKKLQDSVNCENIHLRFVNPISLLSSYDLKFHGDYNIECYFRLCSPLILHNFEKVVFTDVDLIFNADPKELYDIPVGDKPLAACLDLVWGGVMQYPSADWKKYADKVLKLNDPFRYFNTGVMLLNIPEFNKNDYSRKIIERCAATHYLILEQDALNAFFQKDIFYLDTAWNFPTENKGFKAISLFQFMPMRFLKQYKIDRKNPKIIHWAGSGKPWNDPSEDLAYLWWQYARKTPFYEEILARLTAFQIQSQCSSIVDLLRRVMHYHCDKIKYWRYKILSKITFGKTRKHYKKKRKQFREMFKLVKKFIKNN